MAQKKSYDDEYKTQAVKLGREIGFNKAALSLTEEVQQLRKQNKELAKENKRLKEENEFLAEAGAFFAASRRR